MAAITATVASPARASRKAKRVDARLTVIETMRQSIPGHQSGVFLVASVAGYPTMSVPAPNPDLKDLWLEPGRPIMIDEGWLTSPLLIRDFQAGKIKLEYQNSLPAAEQMDPDNETVDGLPQQMKLMVRTIVESPLTKQYHDILCLADLIKRTGLPVRNSKVTKPYLKGEYAIFLRAVLEFEMVKRNRPEVVDLVTVQLERIEAM